MNDKYYTDSSGKCEVYCKNKVIAKAYIGYSGHSIRILQGMPREETMQKLRQDVPEFLIANNIPDNYRPLVFSK
jgi:hypothetical protein